MLLLSLVWTIPTGIGLYCICAWPLAWPELTAGGLEDFWACICLATANCVCGSGGGDGIEGIDPCGELVDELKSLELISLC